MIKEIFSNLNYILSKNPLSSPIWIKLHIGGVELNCIFYFSDQKLTTRLSFIFLSQKVFNLSKSSKILNQNMKLNKIKTTLLLAELNQLKKPFKFFTLEKNPPNRKSRNIALSKTLTKILAKNINCLIILMLVFKISAYY